MYGRRVNSFVLVLVFHHTDTSLYLLSLALALSIHNKLLNKQLQADGALRTVARGKIRHYRQLYINRPEPIAFMPVAADTAGRIYEDFSRLLFLHVHREVSALDNDSDTRGMRTI